MQAIRNAAVAYMQRGLSVVPIEPRAKRPLISWERYQRERASRAEVGRWFERWPDANVGIVTGTVSGLVVLDIDPRHGGEESLLELEKAHDHLPETVQAITGGGGRHLYFAHPGGIVRNRVGIAPGIDLRGDGGLVVAPPSIHPSGKRYRWNEPHDLFTRALAPLPNWLLQLDHESGRGHPIAHWRGLVKEGVEEGARNNAIASLTGHLLWHGVDTSVALDLLLCWNAARCRPPLTTEEVAQTVESIARLHERRGESLKSNKAH